MPRNQNLLCFLILILAFPFIGSAQKQKLIIKPLPNWIKKVPINSSLKVNESHVENGCYYMLLDEQILVKEELEYNHYALKIMSDAGVQSGSEISVVYDPSYQELQFHYIRVLRKKETIQQLGIAQVQFLQREEDLDSKIYDGSFTAYIALTDVRKGDVIEYAYTLKGRNPVFKNTFFSIRALEFSQPIAQEYLRYSTPTNRKLYHKINGKKVLKQKTFIENGYSVLEIESSCLEPIEAEENVPYKSDPQYPYITVSEFETWEQVVKWALPLYELDNPNSAELKKKVAEIVTPYKKKEDQIMAIIRFVQDEIRYLGLESGISSHKPTESALVLKRRFGDCKDKSLLLFRMLREIGISSSPALISTNTRQYLENDLPGPQQFDHVTLTFLFNNVSYWVDPTISYQRGDISRFQFPDYAWALVIKEGENKLSSIQSNTAIRKKVIQEEFTIADSTSPVKLKVTSKFYGVEADNIRYDFATSSINEIEKGYTSFYQKIYSRVKKTKGIETFDNDSENIFTVCENYEINKMWTFDKESGNINLEVYPEALMADIVVPEQRIRKYPLALNYPLVLEQQIELVLPSNWDINEDALSKKNPHFVYQYNSRKTEANRIILQYSYIIGKDEVEPYDMEQFCTDLTEAKRLNAYSISWSSNSPNNVAKTIQSGDTNWILVFWTLILCLLCLYFFQKVYAWDQAPRGYVKYAANIEGWLILHGIGMFISPFILLYNFSVAGYFNINTWESFTATQNKALYGVFFTIEMSSWIILFCLNILCIVLFLNRRSSYPKIYLFFISYFFFSLLLDIVFAKMVNSEAYLDEIIRSLFSVGINASIWGTYLFRSNRSKITFVYTYDKSLELHEETPWNSIKGYETPIE
ncbi:MAG: hypothetical protein CFE21_16055 [Bacteroidetes bacterium B1(2017)]|nr:MAG: hypothetical protein CFE21_16055 [Bacteroidetes bacterium B1(2017)]